MDKNELLGVMRTVAGEMLGDIERLMRPPPIQVETGEPDPDPDPIAECDSLAEQVAELSRRIDTNSGCIINDRGQLAELAGGLDKAWTEFTELAERVDATERWLQASSDWKADLSIAIGNLQAQVGAPTPAPTPCEHPEGAVRCIGHLNATELWWCLFCGAKRVGKEEWELPQPQGEQAEVAG